MRHSHHQYSAFLVDAGSVSRLPPGERHGRRGRSAGNRASVAEVFDSLLRGQSTIPIQHQKGFADKCKFAPKCGDWIDDSKTEFLPFDYLAPTNQIVLTVHLGRIRHTTLTFTTADLSHRRESD
jgi:hypothetical protein